MIAADGWQNMYDCVYVRNTTIGNSYDINHPITGIRFVDTGLFVVTCRD
jgi:hypothetical protein